MNLPPPHLPAGANPPPAVAGRALASRAGQPPGATPPAATGHTVDTWRAAQLVTRALLTNVGGRGRLLALGASSAAVLLVAWLIARGVVINSESTAVFFVDQVGFAFAVPLYALFTAAPGLLECSNEGSLIYLWLRPISRLSIALGGWWSALAIALPFSLLTTLGAVFVFGVGPNILAATAVAAVLATAAYAALFSLLGLLSRFATILGLAYIVVWESVIAGLGGLGRQLSVHFYAASFLASRVSEEQRLQLPTLDYASTWVATVVLSAFMVVSVSVTAWRLSRMDVK